MMWLTRVVFPEDSGPKISTMRPRGTPPMPSARSSARAPVGIASTLTVPLSPRRISEPSPNSLRMPVTALSRAASLAFASLAETSFKFLLSAISITSLLPWSEQLDLGQRDVSRTRRLEFRTVERQAAAKACLSRRRRQLTWGLLHCHRPPRPAPLGTNPGDRHMRPEGPPLRLIELLGDQDLTHLGLQAPGRGRGHRHREDPRPPPLRPSYRIEQLDSRHGGRQPHQRRDGPLDLFRRPLTEKGQGDV